MIRKLATVQKILELNPIPEADKIEVATVLGWKCVVKKGEFKVDDLVVYCEIDSMLPELPEFEFLRPRGFRIRTIRLRKQISQGICFPISVLPNIPIEEGQDVSEELSVTKYEPPIPVALSGKVKGNFPGWFPKTDETRIQTVPNVLQRHRGKVFNVTEKLDGSSITMFLKEGVFGVCSRNLELLETDGNTLWATARKEGWEEKLREIAAAFDIDVAIQGELIGPGIQQNKYDLKEHRIYAFNIFDIKKYSFYAQDAFLELSEHFELKTVPLIDTITLSHSVDELVELSIGKSLLNQSTSREGVVLRPRDQEERDDELGRLSFKVINPEFLLKYNE